MSHMARPSTAPVRKQVNLPAELASEIDDFRFSHRFASESEAIRRLIELGLSAVRLAPAPPVRDIGMTRKPPE
jgi:hypothetical protein